MIRTRLTGWGIFLVGIIFSVLFRAAITNNFVR